ncbi:MAG TPA: zinc ribbon domain-containing protein [Pyrinomonadaceae bacterium]|nr:zinc ribbon domain-containing protein [Pyrinomonadaceae bacterium]
MYCPKCSQPQPEGMRFCSKCGFTLSGVSVLLENNGVLPQTPAVSTRGISSRNRMMIESVALTAFAWLIVLIASDWFHSHGASEIAARAAAIVFALIGLIGLFRFLYAFLFVKDPGRPASITPPTEVSVHSLSDKPSYGALPPQQSIPISDYPLRANTNEIRPRPSVTENTTRLLDE